MANYQYLEGSRYGMLQVSSIAGRDHNGFTLWNCKCDCGNTCVASTAYLHSKGVKKSCGCIKTSNITYKGKKTTISKLAKEYGILYSTMRYRILKQGMTPEEAVAKSLEKRGDDD